MSAGVSRPRSRFRRGSVAPPRHGHPGTDPIVVTVVPARRVSGQSRRPSYQTPRRRKLTSEQEAAIRASGGNRTLRELAAEFGVSHETIRSVARRNGTVKARE